MSNERGTGSMTECEGGTGNMTEYEGGGNETEEYEYERTKSLIFVPKYRLTERRSVLARKNGSCFDVKISKLYLFSRYS